MIYSLDNITFLTDFIEDFDDLITNFNEVSKNQLDFYSIRQSNNKKCIFIRNSDCPESKTLSCYEINIFNNLFVVRV